MLYLPLPLPRQQYWDSVCYPVKAEQLIFIFIASTIEPNLHIHPNCFPSSLLFQLYFLANL